MCSIEIFNTLKYKTRTNIYSETWHIEINILFYWQIIERNKVKRIMEEQNNSDEFLIGSCCVCENDLEIA